MAIGCLARLCWIAGARTCRGARNAQTSLLPVGVPAAVGRSRRADPRLQVRGRRLPGLPADAVPGARGMALGRSGGTVLVAWPGACHGHCSAGPAAGVTPRARARCADPDQR
ncbi:hypothetical protein G6F68_016651 [Rhizopus microsporus]|nr:hypothetical protein G6F68_016651 [Rhizopus microsporus]